MTRLATVFQIAPSRGGDVARSMLGTDGKKVVTSDRLPSYAWIKRHQFCWAHVKRDFQAMVDRGGESAEFGCSVGGIGSEMGRWPERRCVPK